MGFDFQPRLVGDLLAMRPTEAGDFDPLYRIASDPGLWAQHPVPELCRREVFRANLDDAFADEGGLTAVTKHSGAIAGYSRFSQKVCGPEAVEIGWTMLDRTLWGGAFNQDMKRMMLAHAFATFAVVTFRVGEENWRSRRALEKIGAKPNGWQQQVESFGRTGLRIGYQLTRADFLRGPLAPG